MKTKNRKKKLKGAYKLTPKKLLKCKTCKHLRGWHQWDCPVLERENLGEINQDGSKLRSRPA